MVDIIDIRQWAAGFDTNARPWLMLGKGPSFSRLPQVPVEDFFVCTLNHVISKVPATAAHVIDIDVAIDCAAAIDANAGVLVMPFHPHENHRPSAKTLHEYALEIPVLGELARQRRLVGYNLASTTRRHGDSPVIACKFFSAEAMLNILVAIGARKVRSLGVDGGSRYAESFSELNDKTLLANGHPSFDNQFRGIADTLMRTGIDYAPWHVQGPVRVFVGSDHAQIAGAKVLEYSLKKHASLSVTMEVIDDGPLPVPRDPAMRSRTGFSFSRFRIPELCNWQGRGIYMDADMLVFRDVADLWTRDFAGHHLLYSEQDSGRGRVPQFSVMLLDCAALQWRAQDIVAGLDEGRYDYVALMQKMCIVDPGHLAPALPSSWNSLEHYDADTTSLIHYTDMPTQPWVSDRNANGALWYDYARQALAAGFLTTDFLYEEVARGHVSPDLPGWLGLPKPKGHAELLADWVPPYRRFAGMPSVPGRIPVQGGGPAPTQALLHAASEAARRSPSVIRQLLRRARGIVRGY